MRSSLIVRTLLASCVALGSCSALVRRADSCATSEPMTISIEVFRVSPGRVTPQAACRIMLDGESAPIESTGEAGIEAERLSAPRLTCLPDQPASITISSEPTPGSPGRTLELSLVGHHRADGSTLLSRFRASVTERAIGDDGRVTERTTRAELSFSLPSAHRAVITIPSGRDDASSFVAVVRAS